MNIESYTNNAGKFFDSFPSVFESDAAAAEALMPRVAGGEFRDPAFALSVLASFKTAERKQVVMGATMRYWLHKLAQPAAPKAPALTIEVAGIVRMFSTAAAALKRPAVVITSGDLSLKIAVAGSRSRYTGQLMVTSPNYGGEYYGRIDLAGGWHPAAAATEAVVALLVAFAAEPERIAAEHGRQTGACCFCSRHLEDARSTSVGYGPVCAERYGLRWGVEPAAEEVAA
jgi:hypothetical protein